MSSAAIYDTAYELGIFGLTPNRAVNPIPSNKEELLNIMIAEVNINIEPLGPQIFHKCRNLLAGVTAALPAAVSPAKLSHASIYIPITENEGVWIEYGAYDDKRSGEFKGQVHYYQGENGLRFAKMTTEEYKHRISTGKEMQVMIECYVRNQMTIGELLQKISLNDWSKDKYSLIAQNCQRFAIYTLQLLGAYRKAFVLHGFAKVTVPVGILDCLEKNELNSDVDNFRNVEKIPFLGTFADVGYLLREKYYMRKNGNDVSD